MRKSLLSSFGYRMFSVFLRISLNPCFKTLSDSAFPDFTFHFAPESITQSTLLASTSCHQAFSLCFIPTICVFFSILFSRLQHTDRIHDIIYKSGTVAHEGRAVAGTLFFDLFQISSKVTKSLIQEIYHPTSISRRQEYFCLWRHRGISMTSPFH